MKNPYDWQGHHPEHSVAGRTDILLGRPGNTGQIVIETKIWPRNDYKDIHKQVESYWSTNTIAGIAVMFSDTGINPEQYKAACLHSVQVETFERPFPLQGCWRISSSTGQEITHYLLELPRA